MEANTLYYTFSTIPQVIGAIAAIIAAFTHFRIANLKEYLIGDGKSVLHRWGEKEYKFPKKEEIKQKKRLKDAIARRSIPEIKNIIFQLHCIAKVKGYSKKDSPTGIQYVYEDRFCGTENHINKLKRWTIYVIVISFFTIIISIVSLAMIDVIISATCLDYKYWVLWINVALFIISLLFAFRLICLGLYKRTVHETDRPSP